MMAGVLENWQAAAGCLAAVSAAVLALGCAGMRGPGGQGETGKAGGSARDRQEAKVGPTEDLMREHGVLARVLLIYEESLRRIDAGQEVPARAINDSTDIIRTFIGNYHEKLEEEYLFPRFQKAGRLTDLVMTLRVQHIRGRALADTIFLLSQDETRGEGGRRGEMTIAMREFIRMYRPHASREDTVLFPAFHEIVSAREFDELGEAFEKREEELFGEGGFGKIVERVERIEKALGINDLDRFTPEGVDKVNEGGQGRPAGPRVSAK